MNILSHFRPARIVAGNICVLACLALALTACQDRSRDEEAAVVQWQTYTAAGIEAHKEGRTTEAEAMLSAALREIEAIDPEGARTAESLNNLALVYYSQRKHAEAEELYQRAIAIDEKAPAADAPALATHLNNLAALYLAQSKYSEAESLLQRSLAIREKELGPTHLDVATSTYNLANLYDAQGRFEEAAAMYTRTLAIKEELLGANHPELIKILEKYGALLQKMKRPTEALMILNLAQAVRAKAAQESQSN